MPFPLTGNMSLRRKPSKSRKNVEAAESEAARSLPDKAAAGRTGLKIRVRGLYFTDIIKRMQFGDT